MAAAQYSSDVLQVFYGTILRRENRNLPSELLKENLKGVSRNKNERKKGNGLERGT